MSWPLLGYGLGFGITWVVATRWYVSESPDDSTIRLAIGGVFGLFVATLWPLWALSLLMGLAVRRVTR